MFRKPEGSMPSAVNKISKMSCLRSLYLWRLVRKNVI